MFTARRTITRSITRTVASVGLGAVTGLGLFATAASADTPPAEPEFDLVLPEAGDPPGDDDAELDEVADEAEPCNAFVLGALGTAVEVDPKWKVLATYSDADVCDDATLIANYIDRKTEGAPIDHPDATNMGSTGIQLSSVAQFGFSDTNFYAAPCHWGVEFQVGFYDEQVDDYVDLQTVAVYTGDLDCEEEGEGEQPDPADQGVPGGGLPETGAATTLLLSGVAATLVAAGYGLTAAARRRQAHA